MSEKTHELWNVRFINRIIDSMADGVFTMDGEGRITSWNQSMERISGYSSREALGRTCALLQCSRCFGKECPAGIKGCGIIERQSAEAKECHLRHKDGCDISVIKNAIEHAFVLRGRGHIGLDDLPIEIRQPCLPSVPPGRQLFAGGQPASTQRKKLTKELLLDLLGECDWNKAEVGRRVGLSRTAIWKYMKRWDIPLQPGESLQE